MSKSGIVILVIVRPYALANANVWAAGFSGSYSVVLNYELHRLICTLLSNELNENQKFDILEKEYDIPVNTELREEVSVMCNLSLGIEERAEARGEARGENRKSEMVVINMYKKGYTTEQISDIVELSEEEVNNIIKDKESVLV